MHNLFNSRNVFNRPVSNVPGWSTARRAILDELNKLAAHYRYSVKSLPNSHLLCRILTTLNVPLHKDKSYVAEIARNEFNAQAPMFGVYTSYGKSRSLPQPIFYNSNCSELIISDDSLFDIDEAMFNWQNLEPIRIIEHPFDDLNFCIPDGQYNSMSGRGLAVISLNVPMLFVQFQRWYEVMKEDLGDAKLESTMPIFLQRYPLFNALKSQTDICLRNRLCNLYLDKTPDRFIRQHSVAINDLSNVVDRALRSVVVQLKAKAYNFEEIVQQFPAMSYETQEQALVLPDIIPTRSIKWILDISRVPFLLWLMNYNQDYTNFRNIEYQTYIKRKLILMSNDKQLLENLNQTIKDQLVDLRNLVK